MFYIIIHIRIFLVALQRFHLIKLKSLMHKFQISNKNLCLLTINHTVMFFCLTLKTIQNTNRFFSFLEIRIRYPLMLWNVFNLLKTKKNRILKKNRKKPNWMNSVDSYVYNIVQKCICFIHHKHFLLYKLITSRRIEKNISYDVWFVLLFCCCSIFLINVKSVWASQVIGMMSLCECVCVCSYDQQHQQQ